MDLLAPAAPTGSTEPLGPSALDVAACPAVRVAWLVSGDHVLVVLQGDVDIAAEPALAALAPAVAAQGRRVVVDASRVDFMDCAGLRAVVELGRGSPGLTVRRPSPAARTVLRLTGELGVELAQDAGADAGGAPRRTR